MWHKHMNLEIWGAGSGACVSVFVLGVLAVTAVGGVLRRVGMAGVWMREFSIPLLGWTWFVWSLVGGCLLGWWHSKVFKVECRCVYAWLGSGGGVGVWLFRAVVAGCLPQSGVSNPYKAR